MIFYAILAGIVASVFLEKTSYFVSTCILIGVFTGISNVAEFRSRHEGDSDSNPEGMQAGSNAAFIGAFVLAFTGSLICGTITRMLT